MDKVEKIYAELEGMIKEYDSLIEIAKTERNATSLSLNMAFKELLETALLRIKNI